MTGLLPRRGAFKLIMVRSLNCEGHGGSTRSVVLRTRGSSRAWPDVVGTQDATPSRRSTDAGNRLIGREMVWQRSAQRLSRHFLRSSEARSKTMAFG